MFVHNVQKKKQKLSVRIRPLIFYISLIIFLLCILVPFYWMLKSSLSSTDDLTKLPAVYFPLPTLENFKTLVDQVPFTEYVLNFHINNHINSWVKFPCCLCLRPYGVPWQCYTNVDSCALHGPARSSNPNSPLSDIKRFEPA